MMQANSRPFNFPTSDGELVDIADVSVDPNLPRAERIAEFVRQIKNPYCYRHGKYVVKVTFSDSDVTLEDLMLTYIRSKL